MQTTQSKDNTKTGTSVTGHNRSCTQNCSFCAVDALYSSSVEGCRDRANTEQLAGRELTPDQWCSVIDKILARHPTAEFDLSGGDCLALPWVYRQLIPYILKRVQTRKQLSVTATAKSLRAWMEDSREINRDERPGSIHITFDGCRQYSFDNIQIASKVYGLGMDLHIECPLTEENCKINKIHEIYYAAKAARVSEILLMRFFPVGRGASEYGAIDLDPTAAMYRFAITEFFKLSKQNSDGPDIRVQCALKKFADIATTAAACKMGDATWCVMPNGVLLICPWAYGLSGHPLDKAFVAGNILKNSYEHCRTKAHLLRSGLHNKYPRECRVQGFVNARNREQNTAAIQGGGRI